MDFYLLQKHCKSLSNKYGKKLFDSDKKSTTDAIKKSNSKNSRINW